MFAKTAEIVDSALGHLPSHLQDAANDQFARVSKACGHLKDAAEGEVDVHVARAMAKRYDAYIEAGLPPEVAGALLANRGLGLY